MIIPETVIISNQTIYKPVNQHIIHTISNYKLWQWLDVSVFWVFPSFLLQNSKFNPHSYASLVNFFFNTLQEKVIAKVQFNLLLVQSELQHLSIQNFTKLCGKHLHPKELGAFFLDWKCLNADISKAETIQITFLYDCQKVLFIFLVSFRKFSTLIKGTFWLT